VNAPVLSWQIWAVLSAAFAALTAIFAKVGVENINSDFATLIRTVVILCVLGGIVISTGQWQPIGSVSPRTYTFLALSGLATGASWLCYFRALQLGDAARAAPIDNAPIDNAPIDKLSVVLVAIFGVSFLGERLSGWNWVGVLLIGCGAVLIAYRG
jgi:bacterial/archaeal transporter family protein